MQSDESRRSGDSSIDQGSRSEYRYPFPCGSGGGEAVYVFQEVDCLYGIGSFHSSIREIRRRQQIVETGQPAFEKSDLSDGDLWGVSKCFL